MADFKTHITVSTLAGIGYGAGAHFAYGVPVSTCLLAGGLCSVSGMLPDVDSDSGVPLRESLAFAAAVVSMMMVDRFQQLGIMSAEMIVLAGAISYLTVRFGMGELLRRFTVHRGMFHSIPAVIIAGELAFLLASGDVAIRCYKAGAVAAGYLVHLLLDEFFSVEWYRGRMRFKKSFGTALKVFGHQWWPNVSAYAKLGLLSWLVINEPGWMDQYRQEHPMQPLQEVAEQDAVLSPDWTVGFAPNRGYPATGSPDRR